MIFSSAILFYLYDIKASRSFSISAPLTRWILNQASHFHTSPVLGKETPRKRAARQVRKKNQERQAELQRLRKANAPHVVLGNRPGDDAKWHNCDLAKCLLTREIVSSSPQPVIDGESGQMQLPQYLNYGIDGAGNVDVRGEHLKLLFEDLPIASALPKDTVSLSFVDQHAEKHMSNYQNKELPKIDQFARVVDLRNSNAAGLAFENRRRVITTFSEPSQPFDCGRTEVQGWFVFSSLFCIFPTHSLS